MSKRFSYIFLTELQLESIQSENIVWYYVLKNILMFVLCIEGSQIL